MTIWKRELLWIERGGSRWHSVQTWLWKRLRSYHTTGDGINWWMFNKIICSKWSSSSGNYKNSHMTNKNMWTAPECTFEVTCKKFWKLISFLLKLIHLKVLNQISIKPLRKFYDISQRFWFWPVLAHYLLTYSMMQSLSWDTNWFAASQEFPLISRNPKVHYRIHKRLPPVSILGQSNPVHIPTSHLLEIRPNIIHPSMPRSRQWSLSLRFPHQDPIHPLSSSISATCPDNLILLDFITLTKLGEENKSFSSSLYNLLHSPVTSSFLGPNILNAMFSNTLSLLSSRNVNDQVSHPCKITGKMAHYNHKFIRKYSEHF